MLKASLDMFVVEVNVIGVLENSDKYSYFAKVVHAHNSKTSPTTGPQNASEVEGGHEGNDRRANYFDHCPLCEIMDWALIHLEPIFV